jgi:hypothetical protein
MMRSRIARVILAGAVGIGAAVVAANSPAGAVPNGCDTYGVGIAIIPRFVDDNEIAVNAYVGDVIDYDVTVFLRAPNALNPGGPTVCPIFGGTVTVTLPDGSGPFTVATDVSLGVGEFVTFPDVPAQKYTVDPADAVPGTDPMRLQADATVVATSDGFDTGTQDDAPVQATTQGQTFPLAPSTQVSITPDVTQVIAGQTVTWTITETNDTPAGFRPLPLSDVKVELSADGGTTVFATLTAASPAFSGDTDGDGVLDVGETWQWIYSAPLEQTTTVTATGFGTGPRARVITWPDDPDERDAAEVVVIPPAGCTPGYWRNHTGSWQGYSPTDTVGSVFSSAPASLADDTLLTAVQYPGGEGVVGGSQILLRAAVAALLNAAHPLVPYVLTVDEVIVQVNTALATGDRDTILALATVLDDYNNAGCSIDAAGNPIDD